MSNPNRISEAEWKVIEVVWEDPPATSQEVISALEEREGWKPATIKSLLSRLVKKDALKTEAQGTRYLYHPAITREEAIAAETDSFLGRICRGSLTPMLSHIVESGHQLDPEEAEVLRLLLAQSDETNTKGKEKE